jgi:hypothetical protein
MTLFAKSNSGCQTSDTFHLINPKLSKSPLTVTYHRQLSAPLKGQLSQNSHAEFPEPFSQLQWIQKVLRLLARLALR